MSRKSEFTSTSSNPATKFMEWKSELKCFSYYDKEKKQDVLVPLPLSFAVVKEMHTVKGWDDSSSSGIYSNEVEFIGKEEVTVKAFKGGTIAKGLYKDIKETIKKRGGHYCKSIYAIDTKGEIINISLKGSGVQAWGDFTQKSRARLGEEFVTIKGAEEKMKGKVKYSTPTLEYGPILSVAADKAADDAYETVKAYLKGSSERQAEIAVEETEELGF